MSVTSLALDQIRVFVTVADEGSFSAAARRLDRTQSAVSYAVANLERILGVRLFDREGHRPTLTTSGTALLAEARILLDQSHRIAALARSFSQGIEAEVSAAIDVVFPTADCTAALQTFGEAYPGIAVRLRTATMWTVAELVTNDVVQFGICGPLPAFPDELERHHFRTVKMVAVVAPGHALARVDPPVSLARTRSHRQIVLSDPSSLSQGADGPGLSRGEAWRIGDLAVKHALIQAGLGWGFLPVQRVTDDLQAGRLLRLQLERDRELDIPLYAIHRAGASLGPAADRLMQQFKAR